MLSWGFRVIGSLIIFCGGVLAANYFNGKASRILAEAESCAKLVRYVREQVDSYAMPLSEILARISTEEVFESILHKEDEDSVKNFKELAEIYGSGEFDGDITYLFSSPGYYAAQYDGYEYLDDITKALADMQVGECKVVSSEYGYHVVCKYEIEDAVYDSKDQQEVFSDFYDGLVSYLFDLECAKYESKVKIDKGVLGEAPDMISVGTNTLY